MGLVESGPRRAAFEAPDEGATRVGLASLQGGAGGGSPGVKLATD